MSVLDNVYNAFSNLDRDFARSKKSRSEFIRDKFGGDIEVGSFIILDAVSSSTGDETQEDIEKLTFIKDIFEKIKANAGNLDSLSDFSFVDDSKFSGFLQTIQEAVISGTHVRHVRQAELNDAEQGSIHFIVNAAGASCCPVNRCKVFHIYNEHMDNLLATAFRRDDDVDLGCYVALKNKTKLVTVDPSGLSRLLK